MEAMLTENQIERVARLVRLAEYMTPELREGLLKLIRDLKVAEGAGAMPASAIQKMTDAVDDRLMADIVSDLRSGPGEPGGWLPPSRPSEQVRQASGGQTPLEPPSGIRYVDQIADHFDRLDRLSAAKQIADAVAAVKPK
jgi:hypothetical protein